jgi:hypothetical protein
MRLKTITAELLNCTLRSRNGLTFLTDTIRDSEWFWCSEALVALSIPNWENIQEDAEHLQGFISNSNASLVPAALHWRQRRVLQSTVLEVTEPARTPADSTPRLRRLLWIPWNRVIPKFRGSSGSRPTDSSVREQGIGFFQPPGWNCWRGWEGNCSVYKLWLLSHCG